MPADPPSPGDTLLRVRDLKVSFAGRRRVLERRRQQGSARAVDGVSLDLAEGEVLALAGGNAFYLEELIRSVAEGKGRALPASLLAVVQARLESLEEEARAVLRVASVFGEAFWPGAVTKLLPGVPVAEWLPILEQRELVVSRESRFPGEAEWSFRHMLVREAAYASSTDSDERKES